MELKLTNLTHANLFTDYAEIAFDGGRIVKYDYTDHSTTKGTFTTAISDALTTSYYKSADDLVINKSKICVIEKLENVGAFDVVVTLPGYVVKVMNTDTDTADALIITLSTIS